jgi:sugar lactone lactonase YvrE
MLRLGSIAALGAVVATCAAGAPAGEAAAPAGPVYKLIGTWGKTGAANGQFSANTHGIAADKAGNVYVADTDNNRVQVFSGKGAFLRTWGSNGEGSGQFMVAEDIDVASDGTVWVADQQNSRLQGFTGTGTFVASIATPVGELPRGVAVDGGGNVLAAIEGSQGGLRKYAKTASGWDANGALFGAGDYRLDDVEVAADGTIVGVSSRTQPPFEDRVRRYSADGTALSSFKLPSPSQGIGIDLDCNLWVADAPGRRIVKYSPAGQILASASSPDLVANDIAVGPTGDLYVIHQNTGIVHFGEDRSKPAAALVPARLTAAKKVVKVKYTLTGVTCPAQIDATATLTGKGIAGKARVKVAAGKTTVITIPLRKAASGPATFTIVLKTNGRPTTQTRAVTLTAR